MTAPSSEGAGPYTPGPGSTETREERDDSIDTEISLDYTPGYFPEEIPPYAPGERGYAPYAPETADFEVRAMEAIRGVIDRGNKRANERYGGGRLGKIRQFFRREGTRNEAETLEQIGEWKKNPKWKKWALYGAKVAGGVGVATAMVATGGAGAILTPLLWSAGTREAFNGTMEAVEEMGWGRKRTSAELGAQTILSQKITEFKEGVQGEAMNEARFAELLGQILEAENEVMRAEQTNFKGERKGKLIRSVASTVLTVGTGLMAGVPLGAHDYDGAAGVGLDQSHRVMWNLHGGAQFLYNSPAELTNVAGEAVNHGYNLTLHGISGIDTYGQISHTLGHGLPLAEKIGLVGAGVYNLARNVLDFLPKHLKPEPMPYLPNVPPYVPYAPSAPYSSSYGPSYGPDSSGAPIEAETGERTPQNERLALEGYWQRNDPLYRAELESQNQGLPPMEKDCRLAINIPASYAEHRIIYHTLEQYLGQQTKDGQPLSPEAFEINIFVNGPTAKKDEIDQTVSEIERFKHDHPEMKVNAISKAYDRRGTIGEFRKYVTDLAVVRDLQRNGQEKQLYMVFNDADCEGMDKDYLSAMADTLDKNPSVEACSTMEDYPEADMKKYPLLLAARRLHQFSLQVMSSPRYGPNPKMLGLFYAFRSSAYADAGGYKPEWWVAEDINFGMEIVRRSPMGREAFKKINARYRMSPRRSIDALEKGVPLMNSYEEFGAEEKLRENTQTPVNLEQMTLDNPNFKKEIEKQATGVFDNIFGHFFWPSFNENTEVKALRHQNGPDANVSQLVKKLREDPHVGGEAYRKTGIIFRKSMGFWGAQYNLFADQYGRIAVKITNWDKLKEGLRQKS